MDFAVPVVKESYFLVSICVLALETVCMCAVKMALVKPAYCAS
jgi:hypothetical protein